MKKRSNLLYAGAFIVMFFLMTFNYDGPDINVYISTYNLIGNASSFLSVVSSSYMEYGYIFLMFCANKIGLDFYAFRIIITLICFALFISTIKYYKINPNFIVGLYMLYLFIFDTIQIRNFAMQFIILFATRYLFDKSRLSILKYFICVAIAGSVHILGWLFLSLLLVRFIKKKNGFEKVFMFAVLMFIVASCLQPVFPKILTVISKYFNRGLDYLQGGLRFNHWIVMSLHIIALFPLYLYRNKISDKDAIEKINVIMKIEIIMCLFLPLCLINSNMNRIFRNVLILDTIGLALIYEYSPHNSESKIVSLIAQLFLIVGWLITDLIRNRTVNLFDFIFRYNLFYNDAIIANTTQYILVIALSLLTIFAMKYVIQNRKKRIKKV